jgi:thioredoxin reductase (NADPH)
MNAGESFEVIIAGGGAAGLSCALFLARAKMRVAVFDRAQSSLRRVVLVFNYLGFPDGIAGAELLDRGRIQAELSGAKCFDEDVTSARVVEGGFEIAAGPRTCRCSTFVLASNKRTDLATALGLTLGGFGGRFVSVDPQGQTALPGCYAVGRITGLPSQAVISAGDGARVAIALISKARGAYYVDHDT